VVQFAPNYSSLEFRYKAALAELGAARGQAEALAQKLEYFALLLRGGQADLDGPALTADVLAALRRIDESRSLAEREWDRLPEEEQEAVPAPSALEEPHW
jgi:hypothetical protein